MTQRNRVMTPRKRRLWTNSEVTFALSTAGAAGTAFHILSTPFVAKTGRAHVQGDTLAHVWLKGGWTMSTAGDSGNVSAFIGTMWVPNNLLGSDMPDLLTHDGDLQLYDSRGMKEGITTQSVLGDISTVDIESAGQRKAPYAGGGIEVRMFAQIRRAPSSGAIEFIGEATCLWLI